MLHYQVEGSDLNSLHYQVEGDTSAMSLTLGSEADTSFSPTKTQPAYTELQTEHQLEPQTIPSEAAPEPLSEPQSESSKDRAVPEATEDDMDLQDEADMSRQSESQVRLTDIFPAPCQSLSNYIVVVNCHPNFLLNGSFLNFSQAVNYQPDEQDESTSDSVQTTVLVKMKCVKPVRSIRRIVEDHAKGKTKS